MIANDKRYLTDEEFQEFMRDLFTNRISELPKVLEIVNAKLDGIEKQESEMNEEIQSLIINNILN